MSRPLNPPGMNCSGGASAVHGVVEMTRPSRSAQECPGVPREFGACTSYSSIAAYRSDAHHLLANVMVRPITGRRSSARSGNDRAPKRLARMPKQSRFPGRGLSKVYHTNGLVQRGRGQRTWDARMSRQWPLRRRTRHSGCIT